MASIQQNKQVWDGSYNWEEQGDEWSASWGGPDLQWYTSLLPRIYPFVPADTILEIAPGYGRWTSYLKGLCNRLHLVDLSRECIEACKARFQHENHISYFVNDGLSLDMIPDDSIDFVFSFDSLVHAEDDAISSYLQQLRFKLKRDGVAFIHHSNVGEYKGYVEAIRQSQISNFDELGIARPIDHWRAHSMSAGRFFQLAHDAQLICINQETINWLDTSLMIDCLSVVTRPESKWVRPHRKHRNPHFMDEAVYASNLAQTYNYNTYKKGAAHAMALPTL